MSSFSRAVASIFVAGFVGGAGVLLLMPAGADLGVAAIYPDPPAAPCKRQTWPNTDRDCVRWTVPQGELALAAERLPIREEAARQEAELQEATRRAAMRQLTAMLPAEHGHERASPPAPMVRAVAAAPVVPAPDDLVPPAPSRAVPVRLTAVKYLAETAPDSHVVTPAIAPFDVALVTPPPPVAAQRVPAPAPAAMPVARAKAEPRQPRPAVATIAIISQGRQVTIRPTSQQDVYYYAARAQLAAANMPIQR
jgi:hypothetical protein